MVLISRQQFIAGDTAVWIGQAAFFDKETQLNFGVKIGKNIPFIMPPISKKLEGHIASWLFVPLSFHLSVLLSVRLSSFLMHSITLEP